MSKSVDGRIEKVVETGRYFLIYKEMTFIFDLIFNLHADLGTSLYTEGTGNLFNVKGATNPVKAVFRKNTSTDDFTTNNIPKIKQGENILFSTFDTSDLKKIVGIEITDDLTLNDGSYHHLDEIAISDEPEDNDESSIYEWIDALNSAATFDKSDFKVHGEIEAVFKGDRDITETYIIPIFELKGAILVDAVIRRNVYKEGGRSFSELTFVVDSLTATKGLNKLVHIS